MKKIFKNIFVGLFFLFLSSCAWLKSAPSDFLAEFKSKESYKPLKFFNMIHPELLAQGSKILMPPFIPGENVAATEECHKTALMMVRGAYDAFQEKKSRWEIMTKENMERSDFIIEGRVVAWFEPSWFSRFFLRNKTKILKIEGKMIELDSGRAVAAFEDEIIAQRKEIFYRDLGYVLGARLGNRIMMEDKMQKKEEPKGEK